MQTAMRSRTDNGKATPKMPKRIREILATVGASSDCRFIPEGDVVRADAGWRRYSFLRGTTGNDVPVLLLEHGAKSVKDARDMASRLPACVALFHLRSKYSLFLKSGKESAVFRLDSDDSYEQILTALNAAGTTSAGTKIKMMICIKKAIKNIPTTTPNFNNRGVFSTHYLKNRLFADIGDVDVGVLGGFPGKNVTESLASLGWTDLEERDGVYRPRESTLVSIVTVESGQDFGIRRSEDGVAPSYRAVAELRNTPWVILTDGTTWRLYTSRVSASTTNYFEVSLKIRKTMVLRYLLAIFGYASYMEQNDKAAIDTIFDEGRNYAQELEENLAERILQPGGIFVGMVKGILDHDMKRRFTKEELNDAKETALRTMYRIWFLLYAESRDLLPARDEKYRPLSLTSLRQKLDAMEGAPDKHDCWDHILALFKGIRNGSPQHNLPQYSGELFRHSPEIDGIKVRNKFFAKVMRGLFEKDGEPMDYASLGVRHLGYIYETLMEFVVRQAERDIMLLEDKKGVREVASKAESTYSYRRNDLYIISKAGAMSRKSSGSYYTPEKMVEFLVSRGLEPIFREREKLIPRDLEKYKKSRTRQNRDACIDRLLDIQVLDPAMGSGHFLVEALNRITQWATGILKTYPQHPLLGEIESDRRLIIAAQQERRITINQNLLTHDVLLKRRIMKRCIFGVDINPLAVELAKVSLWLDSFAIGVPLTYLNHHIKAGDSTIGAWPSDISDAQNQSLDDWTEATNRFSRIMERVSQSADITVGQARTSEDTHSEYENFMKPHKVGLDVYCASQIDSTILPKKARKNPTEYIRRFARPDRDDEMNQVLRKTNELYGKYSFFHWELEMMDAFTDSRYGYDLIVGNPPWDNVMPYDDEFFTPHYPEFRRISPNTKKAGKKNEILKQSRIKAEYEQYLQSFRERSAFYDTYEQQGEGHKDMWQLMLERMFSLVGRDGIVSVLIPSQLLSNASSASMRKTVLDTNIQQMYVFENRKKIFPIHSSYRFLLLTLRNSRGSDSFRAGFYLHDLRSLETEDIERDKFHAISKETIRTVSPKTLQIPEAGGQHLAVLAKISRGNVLGTESKDGWSVALSSGFNKTNDADLLKNHRSGWFVLEGKHIHQFNHAFAKPGFTSDVTVGLRREKRKQVYKNRYKQFYHSYRVAFRDISGPTNMRTTIAAVIPPQRFHTYSMYSFVLTRNGTFENNNDYNRHTAYLCGVLNSMPFDFAARSKVQMHVSTIIKTVPLPNTLHYDEIAELAAKMSVGTDEFEGFAESLRVENGRPPPPERIRAAAKLDALVAHSYGLTRDEYETVLESFKFGENPALLEAEDADLNDNKVLRQFYGEVRKMALPYYDEIGGGGPA